MVPKLALAAGTFAVCGSNPGVVLENGRMNPTGNRDLKTHRKLKKESLESGGGWQEVALWLRTTHGLQPQSAKVPVANAAFGTIPDHEKINYSVAQDGPKTNFSIFHLQAPLPIAFCVWMLHVLEFRGYFS